MTTTSYSASWATFENPGTGCDFQTLSDFIRGPFDASQEGKSGRRGCPEIVQTGCRDRFVEDEGHGTGNAQFGRPNPPDELSLPCRFGVLLSHGKVSPRWRVEPWMAKIVRLPRAVGTGDGLSRLRS